MFLESHVFTILFGYVAFVMSFIFSRRFSRVFLLYLKVNVQTNLAFPKSTFRLV